MEWTIRGGHRKAVCEVRGTLCVCVCVCARARACVCVRVRARAHVFILPMIGQGKGPTALTGHASLRSLEHRGEVFRFVCRALASLVCNVQQRVGGVDNKVS